MYDTSSFEEDIDIDDVSPRKISYFPAEIEFFEESPDKKYELADAKTSENDSSSDKNQKLTSCESFKRDSSAKKSYAQLSEIDFSTLFEKHNLSETCLTVQKHNVPFTQSSESNCFGINKEQESSESGFQKSENGCIFPDKICELVDNKPSKSDSRSSEFDHQLSKNNSQQTEGDYESPGCDWPSLIKKIAFSDYQLSKSDGSSLDEKCEIADDQSTKKFSDSSDKNPERIPIQSLIDDCSYFSFTPSLGSEHCSSNEKYNSTHSSENNPSSSPSEKCDFTDTSDGISSEVGIDLDVQSSENVYSLSNRKRTLSDSSPSESDTSTFSHYKSTLEIYLPAPNEPSNSSYIHSHETDNYISHLSELLNDGEFSNYHRTARKVVRDLLGDDFSIYTTETATSAESSDVENLAPQSKPGNIESCNVCNQSADDCEKMLSQIIRTAYQFTRHSYRKKLTLKDIEKAFKVHKVDSMLAKNYFPIDETDSAAPTKGEELKPFECIGKWLKKI